MSPTVSSIGTRIFVAAAILAAGLLTTPVHAEDAAPLNLPDFAKSVQSKLQQVRQPGELARPGFPFGHFLKPPPPPPPEEAEAGPAAAVQIVLPPEIKAQGTMNMGGRLVVVMSDGTHGIGDVVQGAKIIAINANEVTFSYRQKIFKLPVR